MKVERLAIKACCGKSTTAFKIDSPLSKDILPLLVAAGFVENKNFTKAGMLYADNSGIIISATFGQNMIHVTCKTKDCAEFINNFEELLTKRE